jgi:hypothetical protein
MTDLPELEGTVRSGAIIVPNEGHERVEYAVEWTFPAGHRTYTLGSFSRAACEERIANQDRPGVVGTLVQCTVSRSRWEPVLPDGVLRLDQLDVSATYNGIKIVEMGEGICEGYTLAVFTVNPKLAQAAARAYLAAEEYRRDVEFRWPDSPVRWWVVFDNCGCGATCPHTPEDEDDDPEHDCARFGLPPCLEQLGWLGQTVDEGTPGALPVVEFEVTGLAVAMPSHYRIAEAIFDSLDATQRAREVVPVHTKLDADVVADAVLALVTPELERLGRENAVQAALIEAQHQELLAAKREVS